MIDAIYVTNKGVHVLFKITGYIGARPPECFMYEYKVKVAHPYVGAEWLYTTIRHTLRLTAFYESRAFYVRA